MKQFLKPLVVDRNSNPEIIRAVTFVGAVACLIVFIESSIHYAIVAGKQYDTEKIGSLMDHFATSFAWIIGAGGLGIAARSMTDKDPHHCEDQPEGESK